MNTNFKEKSFAIHLDPKGVSTYTAQFYLEGIVAEAKANGLTVSGNNWPPTRRGIEGNAGQGNLITFGTSKTHDAEWVERPDYAREKGITPVYLIGEGMKAGDYQKIMSRIKEYAEANYGTRLSGGLRARVYNDFTVINDTEGNKVLLKNKDVKTLYYMVA